MTGWQPIETAPKVEDTVILIWPRDNEHATASWDGHRWCVCCCGQSAWDATHWMPLPEPPK